LSVYYAECESHTSNFNMVLKIEFVLYPQMFVLYPQLRLMSGQHNDNIPPNRWIILLSQIHNSTLQTVM
jgi:hypothetical protein